MMLMARKVITSSPCWLKSSPSVLDHAAARAALGRRRLEHGEARRQPVARPHRLQPADLVDAGRADAVGVLQVPVDEKPHEHGARVCQPLATSPPQIERFAASGSVWKYCGSKRRAEGDDLGLARRSRAAELDHLGRAIILEKKRVAMKPSGSGARSERAICSEKTRARQARLPPRSRAAMVAAARAAPVAEW